MEDFHKSDEDYHHLFVLKDLMNYILDNYRFKGNQQMAHALKYKVIVS